MRVLVISDTHGMIDRAIYIARTGNFDKILHLGDTYTDAKNIAKKTGIDTIGVLGNCDFASGELEKTIVLNGCKIKLTHGHKYDVKYSNDLLKFLIRQEGLDIVLYGHTHVADVEWLARSLILNPGSISLPRDGAPSYAIIEINEDGKFFAKITRQ